MNSFVASAAAFQLFQAALQSSTDSDAVRTFIQDLPVLPKEQVPREDNCPICLLPFIEILHDEDGKGDDEEGGVTKIEGCGHLFCRRDLIEWIKTHHLNCPTCRFQFIQINTYQDDASSDGGEYLPSSEGEDIEIEGEDIEIDANASEFVNSPGNGLVVPDWEDELNVNSGPFIDPELEGHEEEEAWMDDYDPEYGDIGVEEGDLDLGYMEAGFEDPDFDPITEEGEDVEDSNFDSCLEEEDPDIDAFRLGFDQVIEPEFDPAFQDDSWDAPEFNTVEEDESFDSPEFNTVEECGSYVSPARMEHEAQDEDFDHELAVNETFEDEELELQRESDFDPENEAEYELGCIDDVLGEFGDNPVGELISDSEQEELEVELGLTDGESNASSFSEDEIQGSGLLIQPVVVQISAENDDTGETVISYTYDSSFLK